MPIIEVNHVTKEYQLGQLQSMKTTAFNQWRRLTGQPIEERALFKALDDINFFVEQGEVLDIIDTNGVCKNTLFKVLAGIGISITRCCWLRCADCSETQILGFRNA
ncbi:MAG: hypothetical protein WAT68_01705 [Candidatus Nitrotoga sp.]|jgi:lipopolysaccharide transport system ATP-binding protein